MPGIRRTLIFAMLIEHHQGQRRQMKRLGMGICTLHFFKWLAASTISQRIVLIRVLVLAIIHMALQQNQWASANGDAVLATVKRRLR